MLSRFLFIMLNVMLSLVLVNVLMLSIVILSVLAPHYEGIHTNYLDILKASYELLTQLLLNYDIYHKIFRNYKHHPSWEFINKMFLQSFSCKFNSRVLKITLKS
jgi:hypothetical protein